MAFPGLSPSREAFLTAAEFGTQELGRPAQLRLQVYRAGRGAGAPGNSSEPQGRSLENRTELAPVCAPEGPLCPQANVCLPLDTPCHPGACANGSMPGPGLPGVSYVLQKEFLFSVPAGPPAQYSVRISGPCFLPPSTPEAPASRHTDQMQSLRPSHPVPCGLLLPQ